MKLLIAGSRSITNESWVFYHLFTKTRNLRLDYGDNLKVTEVVSGNAKGVDQIGEKWARIQNIPVKIFKPDWDNLGKAAGFIRNEEMVKYCDFAIIIWDNKSKGTAHTIHLLDKHKKLYHLVTG